MGIVLIHGYLENHYSLIDQSDMCALSDVPLIQQ